MIIDYMYWIPGNSQEIQQFRSSFKGIYKRQFSIMVSVALQHYVQFEIKINNISCNYRKGLIIDYAYRICGPTYGMPFCKYHQYYNQTKYILYGLQAITFNGGSLLGYERICLFICTYIRPHRFFVYFQNINLKQCKFRG